jgi:hypothetical protein
MEAWQILIGVNTFLTFIVAIFYKALRSDIKDIKEDNLKGHAGLSEDIKELKDDNREQHRDITRDIQTRTLIVTCEKVHEAIDKEIHVHGSHGNAGEVIKR